SQQQQQPSHQFVQRTNSQVAMRPGDVPPGGYIGAGNSGVYMGAMDPRAPSNVGMYRGANAEPSLPITNTAQQQQRPGTPSQQPMGDMNSGYAMNSFAQQAQLQQPPRLDSPRSRANTYNGPQHTGNFGTLTGNTQMHPSPQQAFVGPAVGGVNGGMGPHSQPNSAPSSPYQQAMGANNRPMSSAGMHNGQVPGQMMQAPAMQYGAMGMPPNAGPPQPVYRSATPVQQSPQYVSNMMSRPPTQMSHSPVSRVHPQQMGSAVPSPQMNQRVPSVMSGNYQHPHHTQQQQQQQQHAAPAATNSSAVAGANQLSESGKEILFYVKVLYDYDADNNKELTIREGDVISVLAVSADGWWDGEMTDRRTGRAIQGTFPSNFTDPISH
ncbi:formin-binding protein, partial [Kickxella alabastrina]